MTTARSPVHLLAAQADKMASMLKAAERGDPQAHQLGKARGKEVVTFAVAMDDKILKITMAWTTIRNTEEAGIAEYILKQMQESRDATH